jgi:hypothetical protein
MSENLAFGTEADGKACAERQPECHEGKTGGQQLYRADESDQGKRVNYERDRCDDETEFSQSHFGSFLGVLGAVLFKYA